MRALPGTWNLLSPPLRAPTGGWRLAAGGWRWRSQVPRHTPHDTLPFHMYGSPSFLKSIGRCPDALLARLISVRSWSVRSAGILAAELGRRRGRIVSTCQSYRSVGLEKERSATGRAVASGLTRVALARGVHRACASQGIEEESLSMPARARRCQESGSLVKLS